MLPKTSSSDLATSSAPPPSYEGSGGKRHKFQTQTRVELNRAAQARFRVRRKARIAELEATAAAHAAALKARESLEAEIVRLRTQVAAARAGEPVLADEDGGDKGPPPAGLPSLGDPAVAVATGFFGTDGAARGASLAVVAAPGNWERLLPRLVPSDWNGTPSSVRRQLESLAAVRSAVGLVGAVGRGGGARGGGAAGAGTSPTRAGSVLCVPPDAVSIRLAHATSDARVVTADDIMRWPWRTHLAVYRASAAECARALPLVVAGDNGAASAAAAVGRQVRACLTVLGVVDPRRAALLMLLNVRTQGLPPDGDDGHAAAHAAAAALKGTLTPQQRAAAESAGRAHDAAVAAARARRAALVSMACGAGGELRALEAQSLLRANLDEEVAATALLTHTLLTTILTPGQVAAAVGAAYPSGLDVPATVAAVTGRGGLPMPSPLPLGLEDDDLFTVLLE